MCPQQCVLVYQGLNLCLCTEICCCSNFGLVKPLVEMSRRWLVVYESSTFIKYTSHWRMKWTNRLHNFYGAVLQSQSLCGRQINSLSAFTRRSRLLCHVRHQFNSWSLKQLNLYCSRHWILVWGGHRFICLWPEVRGHQRGRRCWRRFEAEPSKTKCQP